MKLSVKAFALTAGLFWGMTLFVSTLCAVYFGYLADQLQWLVGMYPWYDLTAQGALVGLGLGFIDGFIGGLVFAWLYNQFVSCGGCCGKGKEAPVEIPAHKAPVKKAPAKKSVAKKAAPKRPAPKKK